MNAMPKGEAFMSVQRYARIRAWFAGRPYALRALQALTRGLPVAVAAAYVWLAVWLACACRQEWLTARGELSAPALRAAAERLARAVLAPAAALVLGTALRRLINAPRPYETPGFTPLVPKQTAGQAFPSRHAVSAAVIAAVWWPVSPVCGAVLAAAAVLICITRVLAGVHAVRDVLCGAALGALCGAAGILGWP